MLFQDPDKINIINSKEYLQSKLYALNSAKDIREICRPLFEFLNVHGFTFQRMYKDGRRLYFASSEKWIESYYQNNHFLSAGYNKYSEYGAFILWKCWPKEDNGFYRLMTDAQQNFNYGNGICITRSSEEHIDSISIRGNCQDETVNNRYITELQPIEKFIDYFMIKASDIVEASLINSFIISEEIVPISTYSSAKKLNRNQFLEYVRPKNSEASQAIIGDKNLTLRETECLLYMMKGYSSKEMATAMNISPRTIESFIEKMKLKTGLPYKSKLIEALLDNSANRFILEELFKI